MAAPTTLKEFAQQQRDQWNTRKDQARQALSTAQQAQTADQTQKDALAKAYADLGQQIAATRKALADAPLPADAEALLVTLRSLLVQQRQKRSQLLVADEALDRAAKGLDAAGVSLDRASTGLAAAETGLQEAEERDARLQQWSAALSAPPLSTLKADAAAALAGSAFTGAKARVEGDIPAKLRARAAARGQEQTDRLGRVETAVTGAEDLLADQGAGGEGLAGAVAKQWVLFRRREEALGSYVLEAKRRYDRALAALLAIPASAPLTQAQRGHIEDAALQADREAAADKEEARDDARAALEAKQAELDAEILAVQAADVDADPNADAAVAALKTEVTSLQTALNAAEAGFTAPMRATLDEWEASVPDAIWQNLTGFEEAKTTLAALQAQTPAALATDLATAQGALVSALLAGDKGLRTRAFLEGAVQAATQRLAFWQQTQPQRSLGAVRGDS